jgi:hypothetical protein
MVAEKELQTFSVFEGKVTGNSIKGISLIQEGPALGHGVWVDSTTLSQVKKSASAMGRVKAKLNHWSGIQDTVGYYENFRIRAGKLLADLTLFDSHDGKDMLLEMIENIPNAFGVSIMFAADTPEYDKGNDRYNTRVRELYSADFVDSPAANRDGVFTAKIDNPENDMANANQPETQPDAFDAKAAITALEAQVAELVKALAAKAEKPAEQPPVQLEEKPQDSALSAELAEVKALLKAFTAAPPSRTEAAPVSEREEQPAADPLLKTRKEFEALPHAQRNAFFSAGGKLKN